jgi:uncharacterized hydrophobic protein (TIGR00271 family)
LVEKAVLIYDKIDESELAQIENEYEKEIELVSFEEFKIHPQNYINRDKRALLYLEINELKEAIELSCEYEAPIAFITKKDQSYLQESFDLPLDIKESLEIALREEPKSLDLLIGAGEIVLYSAQIGKTPPFSYQASTYKNRSLKSRLIAFKEMLSKFRELNPCKVTLKTKKGKEIETVATGIMIIEHDNHTLASNLMGEAVKSNDSRLSALIISPSSMLSYFSFLFKVIVLKKDLKELNKDIGLIETQELTISSDPKMDVMIDGEVVAKTPQKFFVEPSRVRVILPKSFWEDRNSSNIEKESIKLNNLPISKDAREYREKRLPLFTHASEESYQSLFSSLRDEAKATKSFIVLILLSTLLATVGLYLNSSSVIIGAMLLAPLMQPIVSLSMGVLRQDYTLLKNSTKTILIGVALALLSSFVFALLMPFEIVTDEIRGRLNPSILDLFVAIISGIAAAYAKNNSKIVSSLVGVSIAVALVPPIAVSGIGLGWGSFSIFSHAFLLFLTNLIGIVLSASTIFLFQGFSPVKTAKRGLFYSLIGVVIVSIPLYLSYKKIREDADIKTVLSNRVFKIDSVDVELKDISLYHKKDGLHIKCDIVVERLLQKEELKLLKKDISKFIDEDFVIEAAQRVEF